MFFQNRPTLQLQLKYFNEPIEIIRWMQELNIQFYVYWFETTEGIVLKYGESGDCQTGEFGERLYRQAGHIPGWSQSTPWLVGSSGEDMAQILIDFEEAYNRKLVKNDIVINVLPMNKTVAVHTKEICEQIERVLINEHISTHGLPPIGNKDHKTNQQLRKHLNTKLLSHVVEFED
jgi:hypothetical protein